jgi:hypothetical protein
MNKKKGKNAKSASKTSKSKDKIKKEPKDAKKVQLEKDYQRLEEYLNESGLSLAFNIIFAELISKQILPENFFTYTAMRLTQIGKEIEGLKTKEAIYVDEEEQKADELNNEPQQAEQPPPQEEQKEDLFMTRPQQQAQAPTNQNKKKKITKD